MCIYIYIYNAMYYVDVYMCVYIFTSIYIYLHLFASIYIYLHLFTSIYIYISHTFFFLAKLYSLKLKFNVNCKKRGESPW